MSTVAVRDPLRVSPRLFDAHLRESLPTQHWIEHGINRRPNVLDQKTLSSPYRQLKVAQEGGAPRAGTKQSRRSRCGT